MPAKRISIIIPLFNEEENIAPLYNALHHATKPLPHAFTFLFVNDGSTDRSGDAVERLAAGDERVTYLEFSRNFGKETATTAGLHAAQDADAAILIDADLQHPPELLPEFLARWERGAEVVIGVRSESKSDSHTKRLGSKLFYALMRLIAETELTPHATDYRLLDGSVIRAFNRFTEKERMTRGLIDWLGFRRDYIAFEARERTRGEGRYGVWKLTKLAAATFIAHSLLPLRLAGYLGVVITVLAGLLGLVMLLDRYFIDWKLNFSGPAILADIILFLVGIVLMSIGLLAFYIGHIFRETQNRPLYVVRKELRPSPNDAPRS